MKLSKQERADFEAELSRIEASNEIVNASVEWSTTEESMHSLPRHPNRSIMVGRLTLGRFMIISNDPPIIDALAQHTWTFEICEFTGGCRPINADPTSIWQRAEDLVAYTLLKAMKDTKGRPLVNSPEEYFEVVHVVQHGRAVHDLRSHQLRVRFRKIGRKRLLKNKIANDKIKPKWGDPKLVPKMLHYQSMLATRPQDDGDEGVLNSAEIPLGMNPLANHESQLVKEFKEIMAIFQCERDSQLAVNHCIDSNTEASSSSGSASSVVR